MGCKLADANPIEDGRRQRNPPTSHGATHSWMIPNQSHG
jgi:hypothetical protein